MLGQNSHMENTEFSTEGLDQCVCACIHVCARTCVCVSADERQRQRLETERGGTTTERQMRTGDSFKNQETKVGKRKISPVIIKSTNIRHKIKVVHHVSTIV